MAKESLKQHWPAEARPAGEWTNFIYVVDARHVAELNERIAALEAELAESQRKFAEAQTVVAGLSDLLRKEGAELAEKRGNEQAYEKIIGPKSYQEVADELAAARKDAERYRWLTGGDELRGEAWEVYRDARDRLLPRLSVMGKGAVDAHIDAALGKGEVG